MSAGKALQRAVASQRQVREHNDAMRAKAIARALEDVRGGMPMAQAAAGRGIPVSTLSAAAKKAREAQRVIHMSALACPRCGVEDICFDGKPAGMPCACVKRAAKKARGG